jgi:hypothetical protein
MAEWIWLKLKPALPGLSKLVIHENHRAGLVYTGV